MSDWRGEEPGEQAKMDAWALDWDSMREVVTRARVRWPTHTITGKAMVPVRELSPGDGPINLSFPRAGFRAAQGRLWLVVTYLNKDHQQEICWPLGGVALLNTDMTDEHCGRQTSGAQADGAATLSL